MILIHHFIFVNISDSKPLINILSLSFITMLAVSTVNPNEKYVKIKKLWDNQKVKQKKNK